MNDMLKELYHDLIVDHSKSPRNRRKLENPTSVVHGNNPLCGDDITVSISVKDNTITDIVFDGVGCAISIASASIMTESLKGKEVDEAKEFVKKFREMLINKDTLVTDELGKTVALAGVRMFPSRIKCALLAWHALDSALNQTGTSVSTE